MAGTTYKDLMTDFRLCFGDGDPWGSAMTWWFSVADEIHFNRSFAVPAAWRFRPSPLGPSNDPDAFETEAVQAASDEALMKFGAVLNRYAGVLKRAGKDY